MSPDREELEQILSTTPQQITQYYRSSLQRANACWIVFLSASCMSLTMIMGGLVAVFLGHVQSSQLTLAASVLPEAVALLFYRQYRDATKQMAQCQQDLLAVGILIIALGISREIESAEVKDETSVVMVTNLLSWLIKAPPTQLR